jgi:S-DNA-T family DNA segregation ATPase FtsK/SpoIIIE
MGKSVCLNSLIVSILYHATPEEVQMILIDPKKVEMGVYNRIPHLIVPVVSDTKKAAGALNWAVLEMEKRFIEMEEVGVRDIKSYNEITRGDPEKKQMSQIVIIIDELADLMMTARDEVETSICRLAQKARAAGMHLVIGTQRPSVDVITGLIKSNVPSRIACTVASQVDSRTIIDIQGAEKLMGKGDMLYAPVGAMKPMRVQGCFVGEKEIEAVCDFIRNQREAVYDESVSNLIEREAGKMGEKKRSSSAFDDDRP